MNRVWRKKCVHRLICTLCVLTYYTPTANWYFSLHYKSFGVTQKKTMRCFFHSARFYAICGHLTQHTVPLIIFSLKVIFDLVFLFKYAFTTFTRVISPKICLFILELFSSLLNLLLVFQQQILSLCSIFMRKCCVWQQQMIWFFFFNNYHTHAFKWEWCQIEYNTQFKWLQNGNMTAIMAHTISACLTIIVCFFVCWLMLSSAQLCKIQMCAFMRIGGVGQQKWIALYLEQRMFIHILNEMSSNQVEICFENDWTHEWTIKAKRTNRKEHIWIDILLCLICTMGGIVVNSHEDEKHTLIDLEQIHLPTQTPNDKENANGWI